MKTKNIMEISEGEYKGKYLKWGTYKDSEERALPKGWYFMDNQDKEGHGLVFIVAIEHEHGERTPSSKHMYANVHYVSRPTAIVNQSKEVDKAIAKVLRTNKLRTIVEHLQVINQHLDIIDRLDPYGDLVENFCEMDKTTRIATRLIKDIKADIKKAGRGRLS